MPREMPSVPVALAEFRMVRALGRIHLEVRAAGDDEVLATLDVLDDALGRAQARYWIRTIEPENTGHRCAVLAALNARKRNARQPRPLT